MIDEDEDNLTFCHEERNFIASKCLSNHTSDSSQAYTAEAGLIN